MRSPNSKPAAKPTSWPDPKPSTIEWMLGRIGRVLMFFRLMRRPYPASPPIDPELLKRGKIRFVTPVGPIRLWPRLVFSRTESDDRPHKDDDPK